MFLTQTICLVLAVITSGLALECYYCTPSNNTNNTNGVHGTSCSPEKVTCNDTLQEIYCLSMRSWMKQAWKKTHKSCASAHICTAAAKACTALRNKTSPSDGFDCHALCCEKNLCNLKHDISSSVQSTHNTCFLATVTFVAATTATLFCL